MNGDRDLHDAFARLREIERRDVPTFRVPLRPSTRVHSPLRAALAAALLLIVIAIGYLTRPSHEPVTTESISTWRAPTDFLLQTPGAELIVSVPRLQPHLPTVNPSKGDRS